MQQGIAAHQFVAALFTVGQQSHRSLQQGLDPRHGLAGTMT